MGAVAEKVEVAALLVNVVQSAEERNPGTAAVAVAMVKVNVFEDDVTERPVRPEVAIENPACLALNVSQSAEERKPFTVAEDVA